MKDDTVTAPRFSIVITCYNQRNYIAAAVDSVLAQTHPSKDVIVVDDGSVDGSKEILEKYQDKIQLVVFPKNRGAIEARNHGAALAKGEYLAFLDGDDLYTPFALDVFERVIADQCPKVVIGYATWFRGDAPPPIKDRPRQIEFMDYPALVAKDRSVWLSASVLVVERHTFHRVGGWTPGIFHMDLYDITAKLGEAGRTSCVFSPPTAFYRVHASNSRQNVKMFATMALHIAKKEKAGQYLRSSAYTFQRRAWFGGMMAFWTKEAARAGLYKDSAALASAGCVMILAAVAQKVVVRIKGRRPVSMLEWPK